MECTQRLECTQELYESRTAERTCPEQIGFLGICGVKHPVKRGPNKIGRDPQTCNIVLNLNSISRQHAVINVLNQTEFMLMDLDSANKTKLMNRVLPAYIPHPLKNGDLVQFGDIFGVFRLLEEDNDLPMTQAIDIPETPVAARHASKLNKLAVTTVPESPDVSDREESFIAPSQPKGEKCFRNSNSKHFIKPSEKVISIQPIGSKKIDNVYWNSSKKSLSLNSQFNDSSPNYSIQSNETSGRESNNASIYDMEKQKPLADVDDSIDSIYTADTQIPMISTDIHTADTQLPRISPDIHTADTQIPSISPDIHMVETQIPRVSPDIHTADTQIPKTPPDIHTADTQVPRTPPKIHKADTQIPRTPPNIHTVDTQVPISPPNIHTADTQIPSTSNIYTTDTQVPRTPPNIHTADTQIPRTPPNIHTADTQIPRTPPNIHTADTQIPRTPPNIHTADTQIPRTPPNIHTADTQVPSALLSIHTADTQISNKKPTKDTPTKNKMVDLITKKLNVSDEEILFEEMDGQEFEEDFASQPLLPAEPLIEDNENDSFQSLLKNGPVTENNNLKKGVIINSDSSTDCEDIDMLPTQKITKNVNDDEEDLTDCEDVNNIITTMISKPSKAKTAPVNFEDMLTQAIDDGESNAQVNEKNNMITGVNLEDMATQVIVIEKGDKTSSKTCKTTTKINLEDIPTQIIVADDEVIIAEKLQENTSFEDMPTQVIDDVTVKACSKNEILQDFASPFKIPLISPIKLKRKDVKVVTPKCKPFLSNSSPIAISDDDDNYYAATQEILNDLCSQQELLPDKKRDKNVEDDDVLPSSVEDYEVGNRFPHLDNISPRNKLLTANKSFGSSDGEEKVNTFVSTLSNKQIRDIVGVEIEVANLKRATSDPSDVELTPKKVRPMFMDIDLPTSQEIKTNVSEYNKRVFTESSSESEVENDSEECTPILFRKKKKTKVDAKVDLTKIFEAESLPTRVITRVRKPTSKLQNSENAKQVSNILKPKYLTEQEDEIDRDIITENITRLKSKSEKSKNKDVKKENYKNPDTVRGEKENTTVTDKSKSKTHKVSTKSNKNNKSKQKQHNKEDKETAMTKDDFKIKNIEATSKSNETINIKESKNLTSKEMAVNNQDINQSVESNTSSRTTRSTRNRRRADAIIKMCSKGKVDSQNESQGSRSSRRQNKKTVQIDTTEEVTGVRRSSRQKADKDKSREEEKVSQKIEKTESVEKIKKPSARRGKPPKHEQSTVYSLSSDSSVDSPRNAKRSATAELDPPSPKRTRSVTNANTSSLRSTPARLNKTHYVLFTAFPSEEVKAKLENLGAVVVTDVNACTVVLTMQVKRTFKLLCAVGLGRPIVGPSWVQACVDTCMIVDPWLYILKDEAAQQRFKFDLEKTLVGKRNFLKGYTVSATPSVMPSAPEMKLIVESSGGLWNEEGATWVCVSCSADKALWPALRRRGATLVTTEFILGGVLRQRADVAANKLR